jgi:hypothetical protein
VEIYLDYKGVCKLNEVKFANTIIKVGSEVVAKITGFKRAVEIKEEDVTGSEDYIAGTDVLHEQFVSISVGENAEIEGIAIESSALGLDDGQADLRDAAESGEIVSLEYTRYTGYGYTFSGFFTSYEENGGKAEVYKWKGKFRINSKVEVTPTS